MSMKHFGLCIAVILCSAGPHAQQSEKARDPFNGKWRLNVEKTKLMSGGASPRFEVTTFVIGSDDVQHYEVQLQPDPNGPIITSGYASKYNEMKWVPYSNPATGRGTLHVMTIKVDERTHYRIAKDLDGKAQYVLMRRLSDDHKSYQVYSLQTDGTVASWRYFDRIE
jgi:hypothetical protein